MTKPSDPLPISVVRRIDLFCDKFEADWKAGKEPRIEFFLSKSQEPERSALLRALLQLEMDLLGRQQIRPDMAGYRNRFPQDGFLVDEVGQSFLQRTASYQPQQQASVETSVSRSSVQNSPAPPQAKPVPANLPRQIGRFVIQERLGQGAFGQVFRARDPQLDREVAIKVPLEGVLATQQDVERFLREARAAATIHHPNICPVYEVGQHNQSYFIVMALLKGQSLSEHLKSRKEPLPPKQIALMIRKLAQALEVAHSKGVIHRDLKPANIMFDRDRKDVVVMDFGLARRINAGDATQTRQGTLLGSPAYMSPEQARGDIQAIGPHSDIYTLGVILYELLTCRLPFTGTVTEVLGKVQHVQPEAPSKLRQGVDPALEAICLKAMAKEPGQRFASMKQLADAVGKYLKEATTSAPSNVPLPVPPPGPEPIVMAALSAEHRAETQAAVEAAVQRSTRSLWKIAMFAGLPALALGGILAVVLLIMAIKEPAGNTGNTSNNKYNDNSVTVILQNLPHLNDPQVVFLLDGKLVAAQKLAQPITLEVGKHELVIKRGETILAVRDFQVEKGAQAAVTGPAGKLSQDPPPQIIVPPVAESKGPPKQLAVFQSAAGQPPRSVAISPDGKWVLAAGYYHHPTGHPQQGWVYLWDIADPKTHKKQFAFPCAGMVAFDPRGNGQAAFGSAATGSAQTGFVQFWDVEKWKDLHNVKTDSIYTPQCFQYSLNGKYILAAWSWEKNKTMIWETDTGKEVLQLPIMTACLAADSKHLFHPSTKGNDLELLELNSPKKKLREYKGHSAAIYSIACSRDGQWVAAGTSGPTFAIRVWGTATGKERQYFIGHENTVTSLAFSPDGKRLLSGGADATVRLWDIASGKLLQTYKHDASVYQVCFTPLGQRALSCSADGTARLWQLPE